MIKYIFEPYRGFESLFVILTVSGIENSFPGESFIQAESFLLNPVESLYSYICLKR